MYLYSINATTGENIALLKEYSTVATPNADSRGVYPLENGNY